MPPVDPEVIDPSPDGQNALMQQMKDILSNGVPKEEHADIPLSFAAMGSLQKDSAEGKTPREVLYDTLKAQGDRLQDKKRQILTQMATDSPMSKSQVAAMMLIGILPTLVGGIVKGKQGLAAGGQAGSLGVATMAKGINDEQDKQDQLNRLQLQETEKEIGQNSDTISKSALQGVNNEEIGQQKELDRATKLQAAGITAGGVQKGLSGIGKALDNVAQSYKNEKLSEQSKSTARAFSLGDDDIFVPRGRVDDKTAEETRKAAGAYKRAIESVNDLITTNESLDAGMPQRMAGTKSDEMYKKYIIAKNSIKAAKDLPGNTSSKLLFELDAALKSPTSWVENLKGLLPGTASVPDQLANTEKILTEDYKRYVQDNNYSRVKKGAIITYKGQPARVVGIDPNGQLQLDTNVEQPTGE